MADLPHLAARLFGRPLCISRAKLDMVLPILLPRFLGQVQRLDHGGPAQQPAAPTVTVPARIAIVPVFGTLVARGAGMIAESGQTSYEALSSLVARLVAKPEVAGILLDIDSGGGEYAGLPEFAAELAAANKQKPVWAFVSPACFSAAYWIASQAEQIIATPSCEMGSIGVMAVHMDVSGADQKAGVKLTFFNAGDRKLDWNPHMPLSEEAARQTEQAVDHAYGEFVGAVAAGRGRRFDAKAARATEARCYPADEALRLGLADRVLTFNATLQAFAERLAKGPQPTPAPRTQTTSQKEAAMPDQIPSVSTTAAETTQPGVPAAAVPASNVVALDAARAQGAAEARAYMAEVTDLCALAKKPGLAAEFIAKNTPMAEVRKALINAQAAESEAATIVGQRGATGGGAAPKASPIDTAGIYSKRAKAMQQG